MPFKQIPNIKLRYNQVVEMGSFYFSELDIEYLKFTRRIEVCNVNIILVLFILPTSLNNLVWVAFKLLKSGRGI